MPRVKPSLERLEVLCRQKVAMLARTYIKILADYVGCRDIEKELEELSQKYVMLVGTEKNEDDDSRESLAKSQDLVT